MTTIQHRPDELEVRIEGDLDASSLSALHAALTHPSSTCRRTVNLKGVRSVDEAARRELHRLRDRGVRLTEASMYLNRLLERTTP